MQLRSFDKAAFRIRQGMDDDKRRRVAFFDDAFDASYLKPCDHAEQNVLIDACAPAAPLIDGHAAIQALDDGLADALALLRDDRDCMEFLDAIDQKIYGLGSGEIGEDGIER